MAFQDGLSDFLTDWSGVHTAYSFNQTNANTGTDSTHDANSSTYAQADTDNYPNYGLAAACSPDASGDMDVLIITDACMLLYIPAGLSHGQNYGLFHNGGGTHAQAGFLRATTTGVEICCTHNAGGTPQDNVIYEIPDASLPGWFCIGFQFCSEGGSQGDMGLWIDGVKVRDGTRTAQLQYGSGNPQIGDSNADHPLQASCLDPSDYSGGNWGAEATINGSGILIANFVCDNPNDDNTSPAGCGDTFYTDYYAAMFVSEPTPITGVGVQAQEVQISVAEGNQIFTGEVSESQQPQTSAAEGALLFTGGIAQAQEAQTQSTAGGLLFTGTGTQGQELQVSEANGTVENPPPPAISGSDAHSQQPQILVSQGTELLTGIGSQVQEPQGISTSGELLFSGTAISEQEAQTLDAAGYLLFIASAEQVQETQILSASGTITGEEKEEEVVVTSKPSSWAIHSQYRKPRSKAWVDSWTKHQKQKLK